MPKAGTAVSDSPAPLAGKTEKPQVGASVICTDTLGKRPSPCSSQTQTTTPQTSQLPNGRDSAKDNNTPFFQLQNMKRNLPPRLAASSNRTAVRSSSKADPNAGGPITSSSASVSSSKPQTGFTERAAPTSRSRQQDEEPAGNRHSTVLNPTSSRQPMISSSVTNISAQVASAAQFVPDTNANHKLHISSPTSSDLPAPSSQSSLSSRKEDRTTKANEHDKKRAKKAMKRGRGKQTASLEAKEEKLEPASPSSASRMQSPSVDVNEVPSKPPIAERPPNPLKLMDSGTLYTRVFPPGSSENPYPPRAPCNNFMNGRCSAGLRCPRYHPPRYDWCKFIDKKDEICEAYQLGVCYLGEKCIRYHPPETSDDESAHEDTKPAPSRTNNTSRLKSQENKESIRGTQGSSRKRKAAESRKEPPSGHQRGDGSSSEASAYYSLESSSPDTSPCTAPKDIPQMFSSSKDQRNGAQVCIDYMQGKCNRRACKFAHGPVESHLDRLMASLEQSMQRLESQAPPPVTLKTAPAQTTPAIQKQPSLKLRPIPLVPPGLGLKQKNPTTVQPSGGEVRVVPVDAAQVTFGPGFDVKEIQTGFESRKIFLKNLPKTVDEAAVRHILDTFGNVVDVQLSEQARSSTLLARASFSSYSEAKQAVSALDGAHVFGVTIVAQLATHKSTTVGKGIIRDGDLLLEFPAPCIVGYLGFTTRARAEAAVERIRGSVMEGVRLFAVRYEGLPKAGAFNIKVLGLPPRTKVKDLDCFGPDQGGMLAPAPNYESLEEAAEDLQETLERFGELLTINIQGEPYVRQTIRACAHYTSPNAAEKACAWLSGRHMRFLGGEKIFAYHVRSVLYKLPQDVFAVIQQDIRELRASACADKDRCDIVILKRSRDNPDAPVPVKLLADRLPMLTQLKSSFEEILRGERVVVDGEPVWDPFFSRTGGISFLHELEVRYDMLINRDIRRRTIALFGNIVKRRAARAAILDQVWYIRSQKVHTFPLEGRLIGLFMSADLMKLQKQLGHENVEMNLARRVLTIRGDEEALIATRDALRKAQQRHMLERVNRNDECPVCFSEATLPVTLPCGHSWCKSCLVNYFMAAVDTRVFPLKCLGDEARCTQCITLNIAREVLSPNDFSTVARAAFLTYVHARPKEFYYCPTPDCPQIYRRAPPDTVLQCPSCLVRICGNCHVEYHEGSFCPDLDAEDRKLFEDWTKKHDVKQCPGCKAPIERIAGCNHITCTRCKTHLCWVCLATFTASEHVYDHMHVMHGGIGL
ncbi:hypothetical protein NM688_g512 [Phlebia brevispora]|uniref:Uncharacterized protein n=1 Tax=Phlebia brevispora TaxID=194682 RepID=A0ACC1TE96_9APHY|nr:hypothetical protein NM688_g512 [Phlebia brevispora]